MTHDMKFLKDMEKCLLVKLINLIEDYEEINDAVDKINKTFGNTLKECIINSSDVTNKSIGNVELLKIDSVIDYLHDELNTGHWSQVPLSTRQCFTIANYVKCLIILKVKEISDDILKSCLLCLDMGLLLGAPFYKNHKLLTNAAKILSIEINKLTLETVSNTLFTRRPSVNEGFLSLKGKIIDSADCPSVEFFNNHYFKPQIPVKLTGCMDHWPQLKSGRI